MKKSKSIKKLVLKKESIAKLNNEEKNAIKGGVYTGTSYCCPDDLNKQKV